MGQDEIAFKLGEIYERYRQKRSELQRQETEEITRLQIGCGENGHKWKYHQVAGDGKYCSVCGFEAPEDD